MNLKIELTEVKLIENEVDKEDNCKVEIAVGALVSPLTNISSMSILL